MSRKLTDIEVANFINQDGMGYSVQYGVGAEDIANPALARAWEQACDALEAIEEILTGLLEGDGVEGLFEETDEDDE